MRYAYIDCPSGVSGDMLLGAFADLGISLVELKEAVSLLGLEGYEIYEKDVEKNHIRAKKVDVIVTKEQPPRYYDNIRKIIEGSGLGTEVKERALRTFRLLAEAEAKVHGTTVEEVHFHEVGAVDSIIDIVGSCWAIERLEIDRIYVSALPTGRGYIKTAHGMLPVPAPAVLELMTGVPTYDPGIEGELVTPTGIAILKANGDCFGERPFMNILKVGYGAGAKDLSIPNILRVSIGEPVRDSIHCVAEASTDAFEKVIVLETMIDDMNPELYTHIFDGIMARGGLEVTVTPLITKKNRPGNLLRVILRPQAKEAVLEYIFKETTTFGIRMREEDRVFLKREIVDFESSLGRARVKVGYYNDEMVSVSPEYESCRCLAELTGIPAKDVYAAVRWEALKMGGGLVKESEKEI